MAVVESYDIAAVVAVVVGVVVVVVVREEGISEPDPSS